MTGDHGPDGLLQGCDERCVGLGVELLIRRDGEADGAFAGERAEDGERGDVGADGAGVRAVVRLVVEVDAVSEKVQRPGDGIELLGIEGRGLRIVAPCFDEVGLVARVEFRDAGQLAGADLFIQRREDFAGRNHAHGHGQVGMALVEALHELRVKIRARDFALLVGLRVVGRESRRLMRLHDLGTGPGGVDVEALAGDVIGVRILQIPAALAGLRFAARVVHQGAGRLQIAEGEKGSLLCLRLQIQRHLKRLQDDGVEGELLEGIRVLAVWLDQIVAANLGAGRAGLGIDQMHLQPKAGAELLTIVIRGASGGKERLETVQRQITREAVADVIDREVFRNCGGGTCQDEGESAEGAFHGLDRIPAIAQGVSVALTRASLLRETAWSLPHPPFQARPCRRCGSRWSWAAPLSPSRGRMGSPTPASVA